MCAMPMVWSHDNAVGGVCVVRGRVRSVRLVAGVRTMPFGVSHAVAAMEGGAREDRFACTSRSRPACRCAMARAVPNFYWYF